MCIIADEDVRIIFSVSLSAYSYTPLPCFVARVYARSRARLISRDCTCDQHSQ